MAGKDLKKETIHWDRQPIQIGHSWAFIIPKDYIKNNLIDKAKTYTIYIEEKSEEPAKE